MKYLDAFLRGQEISSHPREEEPRKPLKPVSAVSAGASPGGTGELEEAQQLPACSCGNTTGVWLFNKGTCWARWVCLQCRNQAAMPDAHVCDPALWLTAPCKGQEPNPVGDSWTCSGYGHCVLLTEETEMGSRHYVCLNCGSFVVVPRKPGKPYTPPPGESFTPGTRDFLPRPLGQEDNPDFWDVWAVPLFDWLIERYPDHFYAVCEAEEAIRTLERTGITAGPEYEAACAELLRRFEAARRTKMKEGFKIWVQ